MIKIRKMNQLDIKYEKREIEKKLCLEMKKWFVKKNIKYLTVITHALDNHINNLWKHIGFVLYNIKFSRGGSKLK